MTVQTSSNSIAYIGNGSTTNFGYDFLVLDSSHLKVYFGDVLQTSGYTVGGVGSSGGGTVSFASAPPAGTNVALVRNVPFLQLTDYRPYDSFPAESHERALDVLTMMAQQLLDEISRTIQRPVGGNKWDAENNEIINVADAQQNSSAANLGQVRVEIQNQLAQEGTSLGYNYIGEYAAGLVFRSAKDMTRHGGILYVAVGPFPKTASGSFESDGPWIALSSSTGAYLTQFTATEGQLLHVLPYPVVPGTVPFLFIRGVYQQSGVAYTISASDGRTIAFAQPLSAGDSVQIITMSGADSVSKGNYVSLVFKNSVSAPATPVGESPLGWTLYPTTPPVGEFSWVSAATRDGSTNSVIGAWSAPARFNGESGPEGPSVSVLELVSKVGKTATYRFQLTDGSFTNTFQVLDGLDGTGSVTSVAGVGPDVGGNVPLQPSSIGADVAWVNDSANTGTLGSSARVRWLVDTTAARNRTVGSSVTDFLVKDTTGQAGTNNITITAPAGKTINGAATETVDVNYGWVQYTLVGTDFKTVGGQ